MLLLTKAEVIAATLLLVTVNTSLDQTRRSRASGPAKAEVRHWHQRSNGAEGCLVFDRDSFSVPLQQERIWSSSTSFIFSTDDQHAIRCAERRAIGEPNRKLAYLAHTVPFQV